MLAYNGRSEAEFGLTVKEIVCSVLPPINSRFVEVPKRDGVYDFGFNYASRTFTVTFQLIKNNYESFRSAIRDIAMWLAPSGVHELIFDDEPDKVYYARIDGDTDINQILYYGAFDVNFVCPDPFAYESQVLIYSVWLGSGPFTRNSVAYNIDYTQVNTNVPRYWSLGTQPPDSVSEQRTVGVVWPLNTKLDYLLYNGAGNITLYNESATKSFYMVGTTESYPIISIKGTNTSGQISVTLNGYTFSFTGTLTSSDTLVIDCQKFSVKKNGARAMAYFSGDFPKLSPGYNNLSWLLSGGATLTELKITTQGRWY